MTYTELMLPPRRRPPAARRKLPDVLRDLRQQRLDVEAQIAALIDWLDATEAYSDLEPDADREPSLGFLHCQDDCGHLGHELGNGDDREGDCEDEGAQCDDEGDLGDSGIADFDGFMEQFPKLFEHCDVRVDA